MGVEPVTIRAWAAKGMIPCTRTAGGHRRFNLDEVRGHLGETGRLVDDVVPFLHEAIDRWSVKPVYAGVFGSVARGEETGHSDIDVLIVPPKRVGPVWRRQRVELSLSAWHRWHREFSVIEASLERLESMVANGSGFLAAVVEDEVAVWGPPTLASLILPWVGGLDVAHGERQAS